MPAFSALGFLGALAIFIYGVRLSRIGVQLLAGDRLRSLVSSLTENRFAALGTGILATLILQSSTATTIMLVGFASSGIMAVRQAMGVILGADIGTTFVVIVLSIKQVSQFSLLLLVGGVLMEILSRSKRTRYLSMVLLGFGFVFFGMQLMVQTTTPLAQNPLIVEIFAAMRAHPGYAFVGAIVLTAFVQNSATTLGLAIALAFSGILDLAGALPIILGANVGTCAGSLLHSLGGQPAGRRVALAHLLFKSTGALIVWIFLAPLTQALDGIANASHLLAGQPGPQIALTHVAFNLALSLFFLPLLSLGARLIEKVIPVPPPREEKGFRPKYLDHQSLESPALAFANVKREIMRMGEIAQGMFERTIRLYSDGGRESLESIEAEDDKLDILDREIKFYLARISQEALNSDQARLELGLVTTTGAFEEIGDIINRSLLELAQKKIEKGREFSAEGWREIQDFHGKVLENFQLTLAALASDDEALARKLMRHERHLADLESRYRQTHINRLHQGLKEAFETSSIHLDLLVNFRRINTKLNEIAEATLPVREEG